MKLTTSLIIVTLAGGSLWAQAPAKSPAPAAAKTPAPAVAKPAAATVKHAATTPKPAAAVANPVTTAAKPAAATPKPAEHKPAPVAAKSVVATPKPAEHKPAPVAAKPAVIAAKTPVATAKPKPVEKPKPVAKAEEPEVVAKPASAKEQQTATRVSGPAGRRDPFVSPIVRATTGPGPICETGKRCLMVDQINLKGIVKSPNGYIAVVENPLKRAYFLRENDPVFNGSVIKITGDSVIFREATTDKLGKQSTREVVKKVNAPVV